MPAASLVPPVTSSRTRRGAYVADRHDGQVNPSGTTSADRSRQRPDLPDQGGRGQAAAADLGKKSTTGCSKSAHGELLAVRLPFARSATAGTSRPPRHRGTVRFRRQRAEALGRSTSPAGRRKAAGDARSRICTFASDRLPARRPEPVTLAGESVDSARPRRATRRVRSQLACTASARVATDCRS